MKKTIYNKLVRDKIPEIIKNDNAIPKTRILNSEEYVDELFKKFFEEAREAEESKNIKKDLIKEIGDVQEVLDAIIKHFGLNKEKIDSLELRNYILNKIKRKNLLKIL